MKGDFSRWSFDKTNNFNGVLHQQGRVLLDSDWNAGTRINNAWHDQAGHDIIGTGSAAIPADTPDGFKVVFADYDAAEKKTVITLKPGRAWVDGMLVYLGEKGRKEDITRIATYLDSLSSRARRPDREAVILEIWREAINGFQMKEQLIEVALGGPDTTERIQTQAAFRLLPLEPEDNCRNIGDKLKDDFSVDKKARLRVSLQPTIKSEGECPKIEGGGYSGFEHYLYRIEIAQIDEKKLKKKGSYFKWSRFNGGLVGRGKFDSVNGKVKIEDNFQAITTSGLTSFYLEVVEYDEELGYWKVTYGAEVTLGSDNRLDLPDPGSARFGTVPVDGKSVFFRLWDGIKPISGFKPSTGTEEPAELESGIRLEFKSDPGKEYRPGDYWTFQVRAGENSSSTEIFDFKVPEGIHYHRVPLAIIDWRKKNKAPKEWIHDCRKIFHPLTDLQSCCTVTVGFGGDFDNLQRALEYLPDEGGQLCLLPGIHEANVRLVNKKNITIKGCGIHTKVVPGESKETEPLFLIKDSQTFILENMDMVTFKGTAVRLEESYPGELRDIEIRNNGINALTHAIEVLGGIDIRIVENKIRMKDDDNGDVAIFIDAEESIIEDNDIVVIPEEIFNRSPYPGVFGFELYDPCLNLRPFYSNHIFIYQYTGWLWNLKLINYPKKAFQAPGGIQIAGGSSGIKIRRNRINGGSGNGIALGDIPRSLEINARLQLIQDLKKRYALADISTREIKISLQTNFRSFIYDIAIEENEIKYMGLNGIGVAGFFSLDKLSLMVSVEDMTIYRNIIEKCLQQVPGEIPTAMNMEMGIGGISLADCENLVICENRIENNGTNHMEPISGIFILHGEKIDISDNRILNNGPRTSEKDDNIKAGMRGGIVITLSFRQLAKEKIGENERFNHDGIPAIKIHDNIVTQPLGQALFLMALGPVSVIGNHFTSQSADYKLNPLSLLAGAVTILNLGVNHDLLDHLPVMASFAGVCFGLINASGVQDDQIASIAGLVSQQRTTSLPAGNVLFSNNQTTLDLRGLEFNSPLNSQFIASLDDISYVDNQSNCTSLSEKLFSDTMIFGVTVRINSNRFQEEFDTTSFSMISFGLMNTTTANQATYCLSVHGSNPDFTIQQPNIVVYNTSCSLTSGWMHEFIRRIAEKLQEDE